jgi:Helix-turn-helix
MEEAPQPLEELERSDESAWSAARQRARERRLAWARQGLAAAPPPANSPVAVLSEPRTPVVRNGMGTRAWSLNVEVIERERVLRGWTQRELARTARIDRGTLCYVLARRRRPTFGTVQALCTALRLTLAQAITFDIAAE